MTRPGSTTVRMYPSFAEACGSASSVASNYLCEDPSACSPTQDLLQKLNVRCPEGSVDLVGPARRLDSKRSIPRWFVSVDPSAAFVIRLLSSRLSRAFGVAAGMSTSSIMHDVLRNHSRRLGICVRTSYHRPSNRTSFALD